MFFDNDTKQDPHNQEKLPAKMYAILVIVSSPRLIKKVKPLVEHQFKII